MEWYKTWTQVPWWIKRRFPSKTKSIFILIIVSITILLIKTHIDAKTKEDRSMNKHVKSKDTVDKSVPPSSVNTRFLQPGNRINAKGTLQLNQVLPGVVLLRNKDGSHNTVPCQHTITTSLLYKFDSEAQHARNMFDDIPKENDYFMICPAVKWHKGKIVTVSRLWINYEGRQNPKPQNEWYDNYLYAKEFHRNLSAVKPGSLLGIPAVQQYHFGTGQLDPRLLAVNNTLYVNFHMKYPPHNAFERTYLWDYDNSQLLMPWYRDYDNNQPDKNWSSLVINNILYYIHWINPLIVMKCDLLVKCHVIFREASPPKLTYKLRGGTPFELYEWPYYIAVTHSVVKTKDNHRLYYAHMTLLSVEPWELVYTSDPIEVHSDIVEACKVVRSWIIDGPFIYPTGLIVEDHNNLAVGIHANDCHSFIIRISGISEVINNSVLQHKTKIKR